jgi:hypothetical protein
VSLFKRARHSIGRSPLWKASSGIIAAALAIGMVAVGVALPASAHTPTVSATCSTLTVDLQSYSTKQGNPTPNTVTVTINSTIVENNTSFGGSFNRAYSFPSAAANQSYKVEVKAYDDPNGTNGWTKTFTGTNGSGCVAVDASASVTTTPPSCSAAELLVLGNHTNSSWGTPTYKTNSDGTVGYSVTATADNGHTFAKGTGVSNDGKTKIVTGTLAKQLTNCAVAACIPASNVSYTYFPATNSGTITVKDVVGSTHELCKGFWVTATSWTYRGHSTWPQDIDVIQKLAKITTFGTYNYVAAVGCGQGDIYASYTAQPDPFAQPVATTHPVLTAPNTPFPEHFLHEMGFTGPNPTYTNASIDCFTTQDAAAAVSVTPATCTAPAQLNYGTIVNAKFSGTPDKTVGPLANYAVTATANSTHSFTAGLSGVSSDRKTQQFSGSLAGATGYQTTDPTAPCYSFIVGDPKVAPATCTNGVETSGSIWVDFKPGEVTYKITGPNGLVIDPVTVATNDLPAGVYTVTATPLHGYVLTGTDSWTLEVLASTGACSIVTPLKTLPFTNIACGPVGGPNLDGSFTLPKTDGIQWLVGGVKTAPGTYKVTTAQTVNVTAEPASSLWGFPAGATTAWPLTFTTPKDCQLTTHAQLLTAVTSTNETCGTATGGSITVAQVDDGTGPSDLFATGGVTYFIDGVQVTSATTPKAAGTYHVTATADDPVNDTIVGASSWTITIATAAEACGQLTTLPFTGVSGNPIGILMIALLLLLAGTGVYTASRLKTRSES